MPATDLHALRTSTHSFFFFFFCFLRLHPRHMEVPRLGAERGLQLLAYTTATGSNAGSKPRLRPIPQLTTTPAPQPTEQGQGLNLQPPGS